VTTRLTLRKGSTGLGVRLFAAQVLIVIAGAATLVLVAVSVAPGLFHAHLGRALGTVSPELAGHLDEAFGRALLLSLGVAVLAALFTTTAVSWFLARRITRPVQQLAAAAEQIAAGGYGTSVPASRLGAEFARLDAAFNRMAATLEGTERRRRELLADLAHELRTPIATLDSFLEGVEDGVLPPSRETWRTMRDQTSRLRRLVEDVGTVSQAEERRLDLSGAPLDLADLATEAVRSAEPGFHDKGVALALHTAALPTLTGDRDRLREVLDNLLDNALRHTPPGGHVEVSVASRRGAVQLTVADDGDGIAAEHLGNVFERFYRADAARGRATGGSGIGLTIARALVRAHDGDIRADSAGPGRGARFVVTLPTDHPAPSTGAGRPGTTGR